MQDAVDDNNVPKLDFVNKDDIVNEFINLILQKIFDGYIFWSPVHYAASNGFIKPFMDRLFYVHFNSGNPFFNGKVAASVVNSRRAGTIAVFEQLNQYYTMSNMPVVSSQYWKDTHGDSPKCQKRFTRNANDEDTL